MVVVVGGTWPQRTSHRTVADGICHRRPRREIQQEPVEEVEGDGTVEEAPIRQVRGRIISDGIRAMGEMMITAAKRSVQGAMDL